MCTCVCALACAHAYVSVTVCDNLKLLGLAASLVVRPIGLLLVFTGQKVVHNVRDEMAEFAVAVEKGSQRQSITMQGMQNIMGLHRKGLAN